jgi:hypothetical protein
MRRWRAIRVGRTRRRIASIMNHLLDWEVRRGKGEKCTNGLHIEPRMK